jgi:O-antigen ligase
MRFTAEIVQEQKAWLKGVSPGDAQLMLDQKYITTHMYTGEVGRPDRGYIGFNTHNQFLESLLQNGIPGLLCFVVICAAMVAMAIQQKNRPFSTLVALLIAYAFTESVFETQYGIMLFILLPLLYYYGSQAS